MFIPSFLTLLIIVTTVLADEWPIPIPASLLSKRGNQHPIAIDTATKPDHIRLIQTVEGRYQWTGDIEKLLREGVKLMDVNPLFAFVKRELTRTLRSRIIGNSQTQIPFPPPPSPQNYTTKNNSTN